MARRKKKKNLFKSIFNFIILIFLLFAIVFLVQKFLIPIWQGKHISEGIPEEIEEEEAVSEIEELEITLYFSDENAQYLVPESRKVKRTDYPATQSIVELIKGPRNNRLYPTIPQTTKVNALYVSDNIAYIDFSSEIIEDHPGGSTGELLTIYSIIMTLTSFSDIDKVQLLVDGNSGETLVGHVDTSVPLERDEQWLKK
ncbi:MAG TPA: GerMN domain-containing protein [Atribacterota bacterium]|nr:GerMN domain-containing protein [Atribacterota bacterium]